MSTRPDKFTRKGTYLVRGISVVIALLLLWHLMVEFLDVPSFVFPSPLLVAKAFWYNFAILVHNSAVTFFVMLTALFLAGLVGTLLAIAAFYSRTAGNFIPLFVAFDGIPKLALAPILVVWFGLGYTSKIITALLVAFFPFLLMVNSALKELPPEVRDAVQTLRLKERRMLFRIRLPSLIPVLFNAARLAVPLAMVGAVVGEFITSKSGVGYLILTSLGQLDMPLTFAALICLGGGCILSYAALDFLQQTFFRKYRAWL